MPGGPKPMERAHRLDLAYEIVRCIHQHYGERVLALGLYGSVARGSDGPYSDIEIHCVLHGEGIDKCLEWSHGSWKAEVDVYSEDVLIQWASTVQATWPLTYGACTEVLTIFDPTEFFPRLRDTTLSQPSQAFEHAIHEVIVEETYEIIGKMRNARAANYPLCMPYLVTDLARMGACLLGLANRYLYTTATQALEESLALPGCPDGYETLCQMVMAGELNNAELNADACDVLWLGIEKWAQERGIRIEEDLEALLRSEEHNPGT
jgi:kanamycin nucleotidyltransferase